MSHYSENRDYSHLLLINTLRHFVF